MSDPKRILVTFGRSDPLHLTEATHEVLGEGPTYVWGPLFRRRCPAWASKTTELCGLFSLYDIMDGYDAVYCGHGATLLEATAAGCSVMCLNWMGWTDDDSPGGRHRVLAFLPAWTGVHLDHSGNQVKWWEPGVMETMSREIRERRFGATTRGVEAPTTGRGVETGRKGDLPPGGASWVHQVWAPR